jgi:hypothetical protein
MVALFYQLISFLKTIYFTCLKSPFQVGFANLTHPSPSVRVSVSIGSYNFLPFTGENATMSLDRSFRTNPVLGEHRRTTP